MDLPCGTLLYSVCGRLAGRCYFQYDCTANHCRRDSCRFGRLSAIANTAQCRKFPIEPEGRGTGTFDWRWVSLTVPNVPCRHLNVRKNVFSKFDRLGIKAKIMKFCLKLLLNCGYFCSQRNLIKSKNLASWIPLSTFTGIIVAVKSSHRYHCSR